MTLSANLRSSAPNAKEEGMTDYRRPGVEEALTWAQQAGREYSTDIDGTCQMIADYLTHLNEGGERAAPKRG